MFNFVEKKSFFIFSVIVTIILTAIGFFVSDRLMASSTIGMIYISLLVAMILCFNEKHKEIMKILLASFITAVVFDRIDCVCEVVYLFSPDGSGFPLATNKVQLASKNIFVIFSSIVLFIIFINHFVMNYNGKASKTAININKIMITLLAIVTFVSLIGLYVAVAFTGEISKMFSKTSLSIITWTLLPLFCSFTVVSLEAFINSRRAEKENGTK